MKNPSFAEPYEKLTRSFGLPAYHELDPSLIKVFTFPLIFGMMFGDMGHGLIFVIGGILFPTIWQKFKLKGYFWDTLIQGRTIIITCGLVAVIFGFLYGEMFGPTTIQHALHNPGTPTWYSDITGLEEGPWMSPIDNLIGFFKVVIILGIIHLFSGMFLDIYNKFRANEKKEIISTVSWLWFFSSLSYLIILIMTPKYNPADVMLNMNMLIPFLIVPFFGMLIVHQYLLKNIIAAVSEALTKAIESISNIISYSRILALATAHVIFSEMALMGSGNPLAFIGILLIVTVLMILALEGIITFAHTLRLHWVEWFSKFYAGDGTLYEGFNIKRKFTRVR